MGTTEHMSERPSSSGRRDAEIRWRGLTFSRGSYRPYVDTIGGDSAQAGYEWLRTHMREGRDPVFNRPGAIEWDQSLIDNIRPMNFPWSFAR